LIICTGAIHAWCKIEGGHVGYHDNDDDFAGMSDADLMREAEEPDNAQASGRFREDRAEACAALRQRGYSQDDVQRISAGTYEK